MRVQSLGHLERFRVKEVAALARVSVRALHHYDELGLLTPSGGRSASGYRLYDEADLLRLQQIIIGRELSLSLEDIRRSLDDPNFDRKNGPARAAKLARVPRANDTQRMLGAIDAALALLDGERRRPWNANELFEGFEAEAKARWGHTDAWAESQKRTEVLFEGHNWTPRRRRSKATIYAAAASLLAEGASAATSAEACDVAERHRESIDRWFYPCSSKMHAALADMYEADARFAASIDEHGEGPHPVPCRRHPRERAAWSRLALGRVLGEVENLAHRWLRNGIHFDEVEPSARGFAEGVEQVQDAQHDAALVDHAHVSHPANVTVDANLPRRRPSVHGLILPRAQRNAEQQVGERRRASAGPSASKEQPPKRATGSLEVEPGSSHHGRPAPKLCCVRPRVEPTP